MSNHLKNNIILIGYMGSGKTSVGEQLGKLMKYQFTDTDRMIERKAGNTIKDIFRLYGEEEFRNMETELLLELLSGMERTVLSTGGGLALREQNSRILKELGYVVFLKASRTTILKRLKNDLTRPLLQGDDLVSKVDRMLEIRTPIYEKAAHKMIITDGKRVQDIAHLIMEASLAQRY